MYTKNICPKNVPRQSDERNKFGEEETSGQQGNYRDFLQVNTFA